MDFRTEHRAGAWRAYFARATTCLLVLSVTVSVATRFIDIPSSGSSTQYQHQSGPGSRAPFDTRQVVRWQPPVFVVLAGGDDVLEESDTVPKRPVHKDLYNRPPPSTSLS